MKIFQFLQKQFAIVGIGPSSNQSNQFNLFKKRVVCNIISCCTLACQFVYIFYEAHNFMEYVECICSASASIIIFLWYLTIVYRKITLFEYIDNIEQLIETRIKYPKSMAFITIINRQVEQLTEIAFILLVKIGVQIVMLPMSIISFGTYFITDSGRDSFRLPFPLWFPFDPYNPIGYLMAVIIEYIMFGCQMLIMACILSMGIGAFWLVISASKEIRRVLHLINETASTKEKKKMNQSIELKALFSELIHGHAIVKEMLLDFSDMMQPIFMALFTYSLFAISGAMLIIQMEILQHGNAISVLLAMILDGLFAFAAVFIACELGQRMSDAFDQINFTIVQFDWYLFPIGIQRMLPMIIANAQLEIELECFGSITCCREVFKQVINRAYSYFMVLRQLGA